MVEKTSNLTSNWAKLDKTGIQRYYHKPDIRSEVEKFLKVAPVNRLAGKYAGILLPSRGYKEPEGVALTNKEKYSFSANIYSHTNLISIEDEDAGFDSEDSFSKESPPAREMNMDWNGWGDGGGQSENNGWSNSNHRAKSQSQSSDRSGSHDRLNFVAPKSRKTIVT